MGHYVGYVYVVDNVDRVYCCTDTGKKLVVGGGVLALKKERRPKQR
jgi:hypothetical protein